MSVATARPGAANGHVTKDLAIPADGVEPQALPVTHWFDSGKDGERYAAIVRFRGRRVGIRGTPKPQDAFVQDETIDGIMPGSGPVSISTWVYGLPKGEWTVSADLMRGSGNGGDRPLTDHWTRIGAPPLPRAAWSWRRWALSAGPDIPVKTRWAPVVRLASTPAVVRGSWIALVTVGVVVGAIVQGAILRPQNLSVGRALIVDTLAVLSGVIVAKLWWVVVQRHSWRQAISEGWSINGAILAAPAIAVASAVALDLPIGTFFDATTPGLFLGIAIGRLGCFLTGCCAGRCTRSRWGVWSSDRRVGARRIPTQLLESATGVVIAAAAAWLVVRDPPRVHGAIFVAAAAAYLLVRQFLLQLRAEPHPFSVRARLTAAVAGLVLLASAVFLIVGATS
jgi:phosphatidylglycerol:prolipoprotein diacylglycerol transferase